MQTSLATQPLRAAAWVLNLACAVMALAASAAAFAQSTDFRFKSSIDGKELVANISRPVGAPTPTPFLVVTNSSGCGDDPYLTEIASLAANRSFAVVSLNSCAPRRVRSTFTDASALPFKTQFVDVVDLVNALQAVPDLDTKRWGLIGHSRGGRIAFSLSHEKRWDYIVGEFPNLKALYPVVAVAMAPLCVVPREPKLVVKRLHVIAAEKDDIPAKPCKALAELRASQNPDAKVTSEIIPGVNHHFSTDRGVYVPGAYNFKESCFPLYEINRDFEGNEANGVELTDAELFRRCIGRGHWVEGNLALWGAMQMKAIDVVDEAFR